MTNASELDSLMADLMGNPEIAEAVVAEAVAELGVDMTPAEIKAAEPMATKKTDDGKKAEDKPVRAPRARPATFASKTDRIRARLGDKLPEFTVLEMSDAVLEGDALIAKQEEVMATIDALGVKPQNRATLLMEFIAGKQSRLNEVIKRAFEVLQKDGYLEMGETGNYYANLLAKPYTTAAAKAQGGNTLIMLSALKVLKKEGKRYLPNENSMILLKVNSLIGA